MEFSKTYNIAIVGYGAFGRFLKRSWERLPDVRVLSITRTTDERARASAESDGIPKYSSRYRDILADPEIDIVVIATPPYLHAEQAIAAIRAGKHVLVEKPLATDVRDGERIIQAARQFDRRAAVNFIMRYNPIVERVKEIKDKEIFGNLYRVLQENYASSQGLGSDHWFWDISKSGGILIEHGVHFFDLANWINGSEPSDVQGILTSRIQGIEDKVMANVRYANDTIATFYNSFSRPAAAEKTWGSFVFDLGEITTRGWIPLEMNLNGFVSENGLAELRRVFDGGEFSLKSVENKQMESSGRSYDVDYEVAINYQVTDDKEEVYAQSAADLLSDFILSIKDPQHKMRVTLDDALASLDIACKASSQRK